MMDFSIDDIISQPNVIPVEFKDKTMYIRKMSLNAQVEIEAQLKGRNDEEASVKDMIWILAAVICNADGQSIFDSLQEGTEALGNCDTEYITDLFEAAQSALGLNIDEQEKNLKAVP